jgi:hydroxymethylpyrimidine pyrophosphatase-like HAD family hydrolase
LPLGASKGAGVAWLLDHLGMNPTGLLALGDGENDIEMLQLAAVGVAMGNAGAKVKGVADAVMGSNDVDGVAQAIHEYVLKPRGLSEGKTAASVAVEAQAAAAAAGGSSH